MRKPLIVKSFLLVALLSRISVACAQDAPDINTMPVDDLATAIAQTIQNSTTATPEAPLSFDSAKAQGTDVIIHFTVKNLDAFNKIKASADSVRDETASYFCHDPQKYVPLKRGISIIYIDELADKSDKIDYTINASACNSLSSATPATPQELARLSAQTLKTLQSADYQHQQNQQGLSLQRAEDRNGVIDQHYAVMAPAFIDFFRANIPQTRAMIKGSFCRQFGHSIRSGLTFHIVYEEPDTARKISNLDIAPTDC